MGKIAVSKPTWEIMKIMSEITDFISQLIFGTNFAPPTSLFLWKARSVFSE